MFKRASFLALLFLPIFIFGCGDLASDTPGGDVSSLSILPTTAATRVGSHESFSATATYSDGSTGPVKPSWEATSAIGTIVAVGYTGLFTGVAEGTGYVTATYGGKSASAFISVSGSAVPTGLATIEVDPSTIQARVRAVQTFTATGLSISGETVAVAPTWGISGDPVGVFTWSGTTATLEATKEGTATIYCASYEVIGYSYVTIEGYYMEITAESDTYVDESNPAVTYWTETSNKAGYVSGTPNVHYETYLYFSLGDIPANVTIESASVSVYPTSAGTPSLQLYNLGAAFNSATCWNNKPAYGSFLLSSTFTSGQYNNLSNDDLLTLVRSWYAAPAANYGLALKQDGVESGLVVILSKENTANRPVLNIQYKSN